ncbi:MAG: lysostaphin resistance A-like protein [Sarcina sp.]
MKTKKGPILRSSIFFLILMILPFVVSPILAMVLPKGMSYPALLITTHIVLFIIPAIIYVIVTKQSFKRVFKLNRIGFLDIVIAILIGIVAQPMMTFFAYISSFFFTNDVAGMMSQLNTTPLWIMIIMLGVTPAISEEITMRGIVLSGYDFKNKHIAALMSGLVFGIIHMNPHQFLYAFVMGAIFGYMVRAANSIYVSMIAHFVINTSQLLLQRALTTISEFMGGAQAQLDTTQAMLELRELPFITKITTGIFYAVISLIGFFIIRALLNVLENAKIKRVRRVLEATVSSDYVRFEEIENNLNPSYGIDTISAFGKTKEEIKKEKIINIPFIIGCILFVLSMISVILKR